MASPATRTDSMTTMPYIEITAASERPPPMSMIMLPLAVPTGMWAPMAAARGSGIRAARRGRGERGRRPPPPRLLRRVAHRALLHARHARRDADHHLRPDKVEAPDDLADEVAQHRLRDQVVGDDAVLHRPDDADEARCAADHVARLRADGHDGVVARG